MESNMSQRSRNKVIKILVTTALLLAAVFYAVAKGSAQYTFSEVAAALLTQPETMATAVVLNLRLPRALLAIFVGANLSVSGALLQAVMKNPLADPGLTGISAGASLVAIIILILFPTSYGLLSIGAFLGGGIACLMVYLLAWQNGIKPIRIILAGVAVNAILGGATSLISILHADKVQGVLMWLNGSMNAKTWVHAQTLIPYSAVGLLVSVLCIRGANLLQLGDTVATNLGANVNRLRLILSAVAVFLAGISVATVGLIGFVGLIVPHICRRLAGTDYRFLLPHAMVLGGLTVLLADTLARTVAAPIELPVGVVMAVIGGPFFLYLLRKEVDHAHS